MREDDPGLTADRGLCQMIPPPRRCLLAPGRVSMPRHVNESIQDTEPWAEELLFRHWRSLTPEEKWAIMSEASIAVEELSIEGLRRRYSRDSEEDLRLRAAALRIGREEFERWTGRRFQW